MLSGSDVAELPEEDVVAVLHTAEAANTCCLLNKQSQICKIQCFVVLLESLQLLFGLLYTLFGSHFLFPSIFCFL